MSTPPASSDADDADNERLDRILRQYRAATTATGQWGSQTTPAAPNNLAREVSLSVAYLPQCATTHGIFCQGETLAEIKRAALARFRLFEDGEVQYQLYGLRLETTHRLLASGGSAPRTEIARVVLDQDGTLHDALVTLFGPLAAPAVRGCALELVRERMLRPRDGNRAAVFDPVVEIARELQHQHQHQRADLATTHV